jgi:hypothetical protein
LLSSKSINGGRAASGVGEVDVECIISGISEIEDDDVVVVVADE